MWRKEAHVEGGAVRIMREEREVTFGDIRT